VNICKELTIPVLRVNLANDLTLKKWIEEVKHLEDLAAHKKIAKELYKSSKHTTSSYKPTSSKTHNPSSSCFYFFWILVYCPLGWGPMVDTTYSTLYYSTFVYYVWCVVAVQWSMLAQGHGCCLKA